MSDTWICLSCGAVVKTDTNLTRAKRLLDEIGWNVLNEYQLWAMCAECKMKSVTLLPEGK